MEEASNTNYNFKVPSIVSKPGISVSNETKLYNEAAASDSDNSNQLVTLPYTEPSWSGTPTDDYSFEVIKSGVIISSFPLKKSFILIGRLATCDIVLEHPSVSRYHAILQYCNGAESHCKGYYIYDLGSTHGTFLNKEQISPRTYFLVKNGHVLKFGGSTRLHILQAPENNDKDIPEKKSQKSTNVSSSAETCSWGMTEDAEDDESDLSVNPFAVCTENEDLYIDDPKKTLRGWFEREGYELKYDVEERGFRTFACSIRLPIDTPTSDYLNVEASVQGKKKEAVVACALEACRTLDRHGLLRQSHQSSRERKQKNWEDEDFYDSDEDTYLDRTGTIEKKRKIRMLQTKKPEPVTFSNLEKQLQELNVKISNIETKLQVDDSSNMSNVSRTEDDPLDDYMSEINSSSVDKLTKSKLKLELSELLQEKAHVEKLLNIVKPTQLPPKKFPNIIGKKLKSKLKFPSSKPRAQSCSKDDGPEIEEEDDDDEEKKQEEGIINKIPADQGVINSKISLIKSSKHSSSVRSSEEVIEKIPKKQEALVEIPKDQKVAFLQISKKREVVKRSKEQDEKAFQTPKEVKDSSAISKDDKAKIPLSHEHMVEKVSSKTSPKETVSPKRSSPVNTKAIKKARSNKAAKDIYESNNDNYSMWMPPTNQSGDGSTHLNQKYGY